MITYGNNAVIGQSGGPTAAINASLAGVISAALKERTIGTVYGMSNGIKGFLDERLYNLTDIFSEKNDDLDLLTLTPGAALGSCRFKLPDMDSDPLFYQNIFNLFKKYEIGFFFYIGGNDSMDTVAKLSAYAKLHDTDIKIVGVPKTVDNDLAGTDHTPGFGSAAKFVSTTFAELSRDTAVYSQNCVTIVEVMGRDAGWLTASAVLAHTDFSEGPDYIYLPEVPFDYDKFFYDIEKAFLKHPNVIIAVSEGIKLANGIYVGADSDEKDNFGHVKLSGAAKVLENKVQDKFNCKVRSIELNTPQRCGSHNSSLTDITESVEVGKYSVSAALKGETGIMAGIYRLSDSPYKTECRSFDVSEIANKVKSVPKDYITKDCNGITKEGINYLRPLILGECNPIYKDGVPAHYIFKKI